MNDRRITTLVVVAALLFGACGSDDGDGDGELAVSTSGSVASPAVLADRLQDIDTAVDTWRNAPTLVVAQAAAETAANLVVGPAGPGYGDRDGDGIVGGESATGLLPGLDGEPAGVAISVAGNDCVDRDVLGGDWAAPGVRWDEMLTAIDDWRPTGNTMPSLASHPMRIVGWATFTLATDDLDTAHEYAGHARLHVDVSVRALAC